MAYREVLWVLLFVLAWFPVAMLAVSSVAGGVEEYPQDFSIYNRNWNGLSNYRTEIESTGRSVLAIQSSMSVISRYDGQAVLVIVGPVKDFSLEAVLVIFEHLRMGGGILIADDFGTAPSSFYLLNTLLAAQMGGQLPADGIVAFTGGVLLDLNSYDKSPKLPVIRDLRVGLDEGALTQGVGSIHLNWATALSPRSIIGMAGIAWTTNRAWCDLNISAPDPYPDGNEWNGSLPVVGAIDMSAVTSGLMTGRMVVVSDASVFINDMLDRGDNRRFSSNIIDWLSHGNTSMPVVFCENLLVTPINSAEFFYGLYLSRILWLSTMPMLSALYPLITVIGIRRYIPDTRRPEVKPMSEVFMRRGQTYFGERMAYYRMQGNYARIVKMIYRKLVRDLKRTYGWTDYDPKRVWAILSYKSPRLKEEDFFKTIERIEELSAKPNTKIWESELMNLFFFMNDIHALLVEAHK